MANEVMASTMSYGDTESLGGRRSTDKVLCRDCNSRTGHEWDAQLAKQLLPFAQMVFPNEMTWIDRVRD